MNAPGLLALQRLGQLDAAVFGADVAGQGVYAARAGAVALDRLLEHLAPPPRDIHLGAVGLQRLGDHEADAGAAARHHGRDVRNIEQAVGLEIVVF